MFLPMSNETSRKLAGQNNEQNDMNEILLTIKEFADNVYQRFDDIDRRFVEVDQRFDALDGRVTHIEMSMVTKDYLDDKLADFRSESRRFNYQLLSTLESKKVISQTERKTLHKLA